MFNIEELIEKWQELGFLEQMPENLKPNVALKYELVANYIVSNDSYMDNTTLPNCIFPIIYFSLCLTVICIVLLLSNSCSGNHKSNAK